MSHSSEAVSTFDSLPNPTHSSHPLNTTDTSRLLLSDSLARSTESDSDTSRTESDSSRQRSRTMDTTITPAFRKGPERVLADTKQDTRKNADKTSSISVAFQFSRDDHDTVPLLLSESPIVTQHIMSQGSDDAMIDCGVKQSKSNSSGSFNISSGSSASVRPKTAASTTSTATTTTSSSNSLAKQGSNPKTMAPNNTSNKSK